MPIAGQPVWPSWRGPDLGEKRQMVPKKQHHLASTPTHMHAHTCIHTHIWKRKVKEGSVCVLSSLPLLMRQKFGGFFNNLTSISIC